MRVGVSSRYGQVLVLIATFLLDACSRGADEMPFAPPATPPLTRSVIGYGVISHSYTHVRNDPAPESVSLGHLRRGSVVEVLERRIITTRGAPESWIQVNTAYRGWIREEGVQIYANEAQAKTASESLGQ
jgi:hypothetical protein